MPTLPTFTVTQVQADRLLAAYGSVDNYKAWLKQQLVAFVLDFETKADAAAFNANRESKRASLDSSLTA